MFKAVIAALLYLCAWSQLFAVEQTTPPARELTQFIRDARQAGLKDQQIQQSAQKAGWPAETVKEALETPAATSKTVEKGEGQPTPAATPKTDSPVSRTESAPSPATTRPAVATSPAEEPAGGARSSTVNRGVPNEYQIGGGDVISINVWGEPSASVPQVMVRPDGKISMPLVKEVFVAGLTPTELEKVITEQLSEKIKAPDVTVVVNQINSKKVFLLGSGVKKEGPISFSYGMTVMQALSEAGGLSDYAKRKKIYVLRKESGRQFKLPFDYDAVLRGERMELNIPLIAGDIVVVPIH